LNLKVKSKNESFSQSTKDIFLTIHTACVLTAAAEVDAHQPNVVGLVIPTAPVVAGD
jgi:hypothetical protein